MRKFEIVFEGSLQEKYQPVEAYGANITQLIRGIEFHYPTFMKDFVSFENWIFLLRNTETEAFEMVSINDILEHTDKTQYNQFVIAPNIEGSFFLAPIIAAAMSAALSASAAVAGVAGVAAVGSVGATAAAGFAGLAGVVGTGIAVASYAISAIIVVGALYGIQQALTPSTPKVGNHSAAAGGDQPSFLYNSPPNVNEAGNPIPLVYGVTRVGLTVLSAAVHDNKIKELD